MKQVSDYKWFRTDHTVFIPYRLAKREYFTDQEKEDIKNQDGDESVFLTVTPLQQIEIKRLLECEAKNEMS